MSPATVIEDLTELGAGAPKQMASVYGYYRQPNGWITVSLMTDMDELYRIREKWEPLRQYGKVEITGVFAINHPFDALFITGGAKEFCKEQIIGMGFHLNPPLVPTCGRPLDHLSHKRHKETCWVGAKPVVFPQMEGVEVQSFQCRFCEKPPHPTERARNQHEDVAHKEEKGQIRTGDALGTAVVEGLQAGQATPEPVRHPYACGICPGSFPNPELLTQHVWDAHKKEEGDEQTQAETESPAEVQA